MPLTPQTAAALERGGLSVGAYPTKTYFMNLDPANIRGFADGLASMRQVVYLTLNTERFVYLAFSGNYGLELRDLFGMPLSYVMPELQRRVAEALTWDSRIRAVDGFTFEPNGHSLRVTFTVHTDFGDLDAEKEVTV